MAIFKKKVPMRVRETFFANQRWYRKGDIVMSSDPIVKNRDKLFEEVEFVEQATAAPGEVRTTKPRNNKEDDSE